VSEEHEGSNYYPGKASVGALCLILVIVLHEVRRQIGESPEESTKNDKSLRNQENSFGGLIPCRRTNRYPVSFQTRWFCQDLRGKKKCCKGRQHEPLKEVHQRNAAETPLPPFKQGLYNSLWGMV